MADASQETTETPMMPPAPPAQGLEVNSTVEGDAAGAGNNKPKKDKKPKTELPKKEKPVWAEAGAGKRAQVI